MKKIFLFAISLCLISAMSAYGQDGITGTVSYALPQTTLSLDVEAVQEQFFAGPYARFAEKYLGIEAAEEDKTSYTVTSVKLTPCIEADQSARYTATLSSKSGSAFLQLTSQGLVSISDGGFGKDAVWRFPSLAQGDFSDKGVSSNLTSESNTLYRNSKSDYSTKSVSQEIVVSKSVEQKAKEAADMILKLRKTRIDIITGDTDADYSGDAMNAAIEEIARLEKEYLSLFIGYSEYQTQKVRFDVVPKDDTRNHIYVAFRISDTDGLVSADNITGKPYYLDIVSEGLASTPSGKTTTKGSILYRVPDICNVKLTDGVSLLLQTRVPIYQFGATCSIPLN